MLERARDGAPRVAHGLTPFPAGDVWRIHPDGLDDVIRGHTAGDHVQGWLLTPVPI